MPYAGAVGQHPVERLDRSQHDERLAGTKAYEMAAGRDACVRPPKGCTGAGEGR